MMNVFKRTETILFRDFMTGTYKEPKPYSWRREGTLTAAGLALVATPHMSLAAEEVNAEVKSKIIHAFDPLLDLIISLSIPISSVILAGAALLILIGQKERGYTMMMNCALGYVLVQMTPLFISLLAGIGGAIS
jgi:hypothetical protein